MTRPKRSKATSPSDHALIVNGWQLFAHPLLLGQLEKLVVAVEAEHHHNPDTYRSTANAKVLAGLHRLMFDTVPADPSRPEYRQGKTLGPQYKHWFRAKFGNQRFRLFFRYSSAAKIIVFAWVNDESTLRTYGSRTDAYAVFQSMLRQGSPPDDWDALLRAAKGANNRFAKARPKPPKDQ